MSELAISLIIADRDLDAIRTVGVESPNVSSTPKPLASSDAFSAALSPSKLKEALLIISLIFTTAEQGVDFLTKVRDSIETDAEIIVQDPLTSDVWIVITSETTDEAISLALPKNNIEK